MNIYRLHWKDGKVEMIRGITISEACRNSCIGGGCIRVIDFYEEVKELDFKDKLLFVKRDDEEMQEIFNPTFITSIRKAGKLDVKDVIRIQFGNRIFSLFVIKITGTGIVFEQITEKININEEWI